MSDVIVSLYVGVGVFAGEKNFSTLFVIQMKYNSVGKITEN